MCTVPHSNSRKPGLLSRHSCRVVQNQENVSSLFPPSISSLTLSAIQNLKDALHMPRRMYSIIHLSKIIRLLAQPSPVCYYLSSLVFTILWHREGGGDGKSWTREKVRGTTVHKAGSKLYQHDWRMYLRSTNSDKHLQSPFTSNFLNMI